MLLNDLKTNNRLGIFFFYDKDGIVDNYVVYLLDDFIKSVSEMIVVCNGKLNAEGRKIFNKYTADVLVRENKGLDVWAYKTAIDFLGWEKLEKFDEVVLFNNTIMGPVYPFKEMFAEMSKRDLDFWGITKYGEEKFDPFGCNPYGYVPEHIQSHFMVYRNSLIVCKEFQDYWNNMPEIHTYQESVGLHESFFIMKFSDLGFKWGVYVDTDEYKGITTFPLIFYPKELIEKKKCPIFKRRSFFQDYEYVLANSTGQPTVELYRYLKSTGIYDINMIWDNILRTCHQYDFVQAMSLNYIIPSEETNYTKTKEILKTKKVALIMHLYFPDLIEESKMYASFMPEEADIYITTNTAEKKELIEQQFRDLKNHHVEVRQIENRGRDVSSLLVGVKDVINNYDYACFVHDKKTSQIDPGSVGSGFAYKCYMNTLCNEAFISNVIQTFEENPRLGIMSPPMPNHAQYFPLLGNEWSMNYENTKKLAQELNITVPMSKEKMPIAPYGTFFWFRPKALAPLFARDWKYDDFPKEPNAIDGTLLHAIERLYPFAAQQAGYYPALMMSQSYAEIEYTNLLYYVRTFNQELANIGVRGYFHDMKKMLRDIENGKDQGEWQNLLREKTYYENLAMELYPKTSLKYQIKDRLKKLFRM